MGTLEIPEIQSLIQTRKWIALRKAFRAHHPAEVAEFLHDMPSNDRALLFRILPLKQATDVFEYLSYDSQTTLLKALGHEEVATILNEVSPDDRTAFLEELPGPAAKHLLELLSAKEREIAVTLLGYPEDSVGRLMTPD